MLYGAALLRWRAAASTMLLITRYFAIATLYCRVAACRRYVIFRYFRLLSCHRCHTPRHCHIIFRCCFTLRFQADAVAAATLPYAPICPLFRFRASL